MGLTVEFGSFQNGRTHKAVLQIEEVWLGNDMGSVIRRAVREAQNEASRFLPDGLCLTQELDRKTREWKHERDRAFKAEDRTHTLELKVRRLQRELKKLRGEGE